MFQNENEIVAIVHIYIEFRNTNNAYHFNLLGVHFCALCKAQGELLGNMAV